MISEAEKKWHREDGEISVPRKPRASRPRIGHLALQVSDLAACEMFYRDALGMGVRWRPDADSVYLSSGGDNLALHRSKEARREPGGRLDHFGFVVENPDDVDAWYEYLSAIGVRISTTPRLHRDGARSFYCQDPDGNRVQILWEPR